MQGGRRGDGGAGGASGERGEPVQIECAVLFADIEGSTERWDGDRDSMRALLRHHDDVIREIVDDRNGTVVKHTGDGAVAMFERSSDALAAAIDLQRRLPEGPAALALDCSPLRSRIGLHRGTVEPRLGDLHGPPMHRCARIMSAGHGGQILVSRTFVDDVAAGPSMPDVRFEDRGVHRLKGFHEPEPISQVVADGLEVDFPPLNTANASAGWLPAMAGPLVGRQLELDAIASLLEPGGLVTLVGPGGVGKTTLSVHVAHAARPRFPDGAWFIDLSTVTESGRVLAAIADALELDVDGSTTLEAVVRHALSLRRALLVIDNCEHLLGEVVSGLQRVRSAGASATLLCTSQRDLAIPGETVVPVAPLPHQATGTSPAADLFLHHARRAEAAFTVSTADHAVVERICARLEGLPLAIELAAARVRTLPVTAIEERLNDTFDLLRSRDGSDRHRTLAATIGWSTGLLQPSDLQVLWSLSVIQGTFDWEAAAAVAGEDELDVIDALDELAHRSLVARNGRSFRLLAPLRAFCLDALTAEGRLDECRARHARHLDATVPTPLDHPDPQILRDRMDALIERIDDLRAAFAWHLHDDPAAAARLALRLVDFWVTAGRGQEGYQTLARTDVDALPPALRVEALGWLSAFCWVVGRNDESEAVARRAIAISAEAGLQYPMLAGSRLAVQLAFSGRTAEAIEVAERSEVAGRDEAAQRGDRTHEARLLGVLAVVHAVGGNLARAVSLADEGVEMARSVGAGCLIAALSNRMLITPGTESTVEMAAEVAELARITGRRSAQGHSTLAIAHHRRKEGDLAGFVEGLADFCDVMVSAGEHTAACNGLGFVPEALQGWRPRDAAVFLAAVERLGDDLALPGTDLTRTQLQTVGAELHTTLGEESFREAMDLGRGLSLEETVDRLRWLVDQRALAER